MRIAARLRMNRKEKEEGGREYGDAFPSERPASILLPSCHSLLGAKEAAAAAAGMAFLARLTLPFRHHLNNSKKEKKNP